MLLVEMPLPIIWNTWFDKRRGMAYGLLFAASDPCGVVWAFLTEGLFHKSGYRTTVLTMSALIFGICGPAIFLLHERPISRRASVVSQCDLSFTPSATVSGRVDQWPVQPHKHYKRSIFYIIAVSNIFQAFAYEVPFIYLPSAVRDLGCATKQGTVILVIDILGQVFGELGFGELSNRLPVPGLIIVTALGSSVVTFLLWDLGRSFGLLLAYAIMFRDLWRWFSTAASETENNVWKERCRYGLQYVGSGRGIGVINSGPINSIIVARGTEVFSRFGPTRYGALAVLVGSSMSIAAVLSGLGVVALW